MTPSVSPARPADAAELAALAALTFPLACPPEVSAEDSSAFVAAHLSEQSFADYLADDSKRVLVVRDRMHIRGYALLVLAPPADPEVAAALQDLPGPAAELSKCYVHPAAHGTGLAAALMTAAMDTAAAEGYRSLWLGVNDLNVRAQAFYRKSGFTEAGPRSFAVGPHLSATSSWPRPSVVRAGDDTLVRCRRFSLMTVSAAVPAFWIRPGWANSG